ncbi:hypothetical protein TSMEX_004107 [Taenia solium]|eukprot:TsM_000909800 transcript=TsM_000909800 gene=TsM_000909800
MQQAVVYLLKIRPQLSSLLASYNLTCHSIGTADDSSGLRHRWIQQRGALMSEVTTIQANFIVVIEAQRKRAAPKITLFQLCAYYLAFLDFALHSFQRGYRLLVAFPDLPRREIKESRIPELPNLAPQTSSIALAFVSGKELTDLIADVTTIKLCRNTVKFKKEIFDCHSVMTVKGYYERQVLQFKMSKLRKIFTTFGGAILLLNNRLSSGHAAANRIPRLLPIVQATISKRKASQERRGSTWSEWSTDTSHERTQANDVPRNEAKPPWIGVRNNKLLTLSVIIAAGVLLTSVFVIAFVFVSVAAK